MANTKIPAELSSTPGIIDNSNATAITIDSSENVGIGTSSPFSSARLQVNTGTNLNLAVQTGTTDSSGIKINAFNDAANANIPLELNGSVLLLKTGETERARLDSSGTFMVAKTSASSNSVGFETSSTGNTAITRNGGQPLLLNRQASDGDIILFRKDGTAVGNIGVKTDDLYIGTGDTALRFFDGSDFIYPVSTATGISRDNAIDLGYSSGRFKDLYLSGGVYLGGTGSANHLDDYEEGTWTPAYISIGGSNPTVGYQHQLGYYTKIGRQVSLIFYIDLSSISGGSGILGISGMPFTAESGNGYAPAGSIAANDLNPVRTDILTLSQYDANRLGFLSSNKNAGWSWENVTILASSTNIRCSIQYYATS